MDRKAVAAALLPALMLYACERVVEPPRPGETASSAARQSPGETASAPSSAVANGSARRDGVNDGFPDLTPPVLTAETERGAAGARNVLQAFARAIELEEFDQAWVMLSAADKAKWSKPAFAQMFTDLGETTVAIGDGSSDAGAGSSYYTAPVTITGTDLGGRPVRVEGEAVLRRANDIDGATPAQLRWHFDRLALDWTH